jgi:hypothetical protein
VITITGISDHLRLEWPITITGMRNEQTEIDALAALRPDDLETIARAAVEPFYEFTLGQRCRQASQAWYAEAEAKLADHPDVAVMQDQVSAARDAVNEAVEVLQEVQSTTHSELWHQLGIADTSIPAPEAEIEAAAPSPLFATGDDFAAASLKLISEKKYEDIDDAETEGEEE